jgi:hypothetical protein
MDKKLKIGLIVGLIIMVVAIIVGVVYYISDSVQTTPVKPVSGIPTPTQSPPPSSVSTSTPTQSPPPSSVSTSTPSPPCNLICQNGGTLDSVNCKCTCPLDYDQPDCKNVTINSPTFFKDSSNCSKVPGYIWNGYNCVKTTQTCNIKTNNGVQPKCVYGGKNNFWYIKTGGVRDDWSGPSDPLGKTDSTCATARETGQYKVGDPAPWGVAPCMFGNSKDNCNVLLTANGCAVPV